MVTHLQRGSHKVAMITGDSVLTAIHVAVEVNIIETSKSRALILGDSDGKLAWSVIFQLDLLQAMKETLRG